MSKLYETGLKNLPLSINDSVIDSWSGCKICDGAVHRTDTGAQNNTSIILDYKFSDVHTFTYYASDYCIKRPP